MEVKELLEAIRSSSLTLIDGWAFKAAVAVLLAAITNVHVLALLFFILLVFIDLITKWIAIAYRYLCDIGKNEEAASLLNCCLYVPKAWEKGYINSNAMKHRFAGKIILYIILTSMSVSVDVLLKLAGQPAVFLAVNWVYLGMTEGMSVLENLRDAGVEQANQLLDFFRGKMSMLLDRFKAK